MAKLNHENKNVSELKYNFTITQIIGIISFIGTTIITLGYAAFSYYSTVDKVQKLDTSYTDFKIKIDTLNNAVNKQTGEIIILKSLMALSNETKSKEAGK